MSTVLRSRKRSNRRWATSPTTSETTDEGTGTTLTGVFFAITGDQAQWVALNIGDSRVYLLRDDRLVQVTTDHSVVQELITAGKLSPEEAEGHPYSNVITRAVGASELTAPDYVTIDVRAGDRFVICSDGLTKEPPITGSSTSSGSTATRATVWTPCSPRRWRMAGVTT